MLYLILYGLHDYFSPLNVFRYITVRTALAVITASIIVLVAGPKVIAWLRRISVTQQIRSDGPGTHLSKKGTPTMGGVLIHLAIIAAVLLWGDLSNRYLWMMVLAVAGFGMIGFVDDYRKVSGRNSKGMRPRYKFGLQVGLALAISALLQYTSTDPYGTMLIVPFFKNLVIDLQWFYIPFAILVIVGSSNAVNLTDGIDGLAAGLVAIAVLANGALVYISGHAGLAQYLQVFFLPGSGELTVFCGALFGASIGFLWYNAYPADVFMGDVGSLGLGGALGTLAVITKHEIVLAVVGGIFVVETLSVIIQVGSFKLTGRRVFKMAPIHHHFEMLGWAESKTVVRFWILGILLALLSLATLKIR